MTVTHDYTGRAAVITGGARGIGLATAKRLNASGAKVSLWDIDRERLEQVRSDFSTPIDIQVVDITNWESVEVAANASNGEMGGVDILVNSAGIAGPNFKTWEYPVDEWTKVVDIDLNGTFLCCRAIVPFLLKKNYGRIVNIASIAGKEGNPNASPYSAAKAGVIGLTKSLGKELALNNIAVNAVTPAGANTRILKQMSKEHVQRMLSKVPKGRFLEVHELTSMVCWLSSEENSFSTAAVFDISGGRSTY